MSETWEPQCEGRPARGEPPRWMEEPKSEAEAVCAHWYNGADALFIVRPDGSSLVVGSVRFSLIECAEAVHAFDIDGSPRIMFWLPPPPLVPLGGLDTLAEALEGLKRAATGLLNARNVDEILRYSREARENISRIYGERCKHPHWILFLVRFGADGKVEQLLFKRFSFDSPPNPDFGEVSRQTAEKSVFERPASTVHEAWKEGKWAYVFVRSDGTITVEAERRIVSPYVGMGYASSRCLYFILPPPPAPTPLEVVDQVLEGLKPIAAELLSFRKSEEEAQELSDDCVERTVELVRGAAGLLHRLYGSHPYETNIRCEFNSNGALDQILADLLMDLEQAETSTNVPPLR